jgi:hypothetical protein
MSDFDQQLPQAPPPPPPPTFGAPPAAAPFGAPTGAPPAPGWYGPPGAVPGYPLAAAAKPPRPPVVVGSVMLLAGAAMLVVGSVLNWFSLSGFGLDSSYNGFAGDGSDTKDGPVFVFLALVLGGFGLTMLIARKVLAVAILSVVFALLAVAAAVADVMDVRDFKEEMGGFDVSVTIGPGLWVVLAGAVVALIGGIATVAARRRA